MSTLPEADTNSPVSAEAPGSVKVLPNSIIIGSLPLRVINGGVESLYPSFKILSRIAALPTITSAFWIMPNSTKISFNLEEMVFSLAGLWVDAVSAWSSSASAIKFAFLSLSWKEPIASTLSWISRTVPWDKLTSCWADILTANKTVRVIKPFKNILFSFIIFYHI